MSCARYLGVIRLSTCRASASFEFQSIGTGAAATSWLVATRARSIPIPNFMVVMCRIEIGDGYRESQRNRERLLEAVVFCCFLLLLIDFVFCCSSSSCFDRSLYLDFALSHSPTYLDVELLEADEKEEGRKCHTPDPQPLSSTLRYPPRPEYLICIQPTCDVPAPTCRRIVPGTTSLTSLRFGRWIRQLTVALS
jgi:hypothetical protein